MQYKTLSFVFPRKLNKEQEDRLISAVQAIAKEARKRLKQGANTLKLPLINMNEAAKLTAVQLENAYENFNSYVIFHKIDDQKYTLKVAYELFKFMDLDTPIIKQKVKYWKRFFEKTQKFIENDVAKDMGFRKREIEYIEGEIEENEK